MKKIQLLLMMAFTALTFSSQAQCTADPLVSSGISPASSAVPCWNQGTSASQTYTFVIPASVSGFTVTSVKFDSIVNLPAGLTATFNQNPATYAGGTKGCMLVTGTTNAACGQYKMLIYVTVVTSVVTVPSTELSALASQYSLTGFSPNFIRVKSTAGTCPAVNSAQTANFVADPSCGVSGGAPIATTNAATAVTQTSATLNGSVNANGLSTTVSFEWGTTTSYGNSATATPGTATGNSATAVTGSISGLSPNQTYHYRVVASSTGGTTNGNDISFTTQALAATCTPNASQTTLFDPTPENIQCAKVGQPFSDVIYLNFSALSTQLTFDSVRIDSVRNLPTGLTGLTNQADKTYTKTEKGCIQFSGTSNAACGQYRIRMYITAWSTLLGAPVSGELYALAAQFGLSVPKYYIRLSACPTCQTLDTTQTVDYSAYSICTNPGNLTLPTITANGPTTFCTGGSVGLSTGNYLSYLWSNGAITQSITTSQGGNYNVTVSNGCVSGSNVTPTLVTVNTPPVATISKSGYVLTASPTSSKYVWLKNGVALTNDTNQTYTVTSSDLYSVVVTNANGCKDTSNPLQVNILSIEEISGISNLSLQPNPTKSFITISGTLNDATAKQIEVLDISGRTLQFHSLEISTTKTFETKINVSELAAGIYYLQLSTDKGKITRPFVKE